MFYHYHIRALCHIIKHVIIGNHLIHYVNNMVKFTQVWFIQTNTVMKYSFLRL